MIETRKARRREIFGWCMFDFANQAYTLLIITVSFLPVSSVKLS